MKILLIGGTGVISSEVLKLCTEENHDVYVLNRTGLGEYSNLNCKHIKGDIRNNDEIKKILFPYEFDVVIDFICFNLEHAKLDFELFTNKAKQFIFISSASAYEKPPRNYIITESTPLKNPYWEYSREKIDCENFFMEKFRDNNFPVTIIRPSHTYGKDKIPFAITGANSSWTYVKMILENKPIVVHGDGTSLWTITHNSDFAVGLFGLLGNQKSIGQPFNIVSDEVLRWNDIIKYIGNAVGKDVDIIHISTDTIVKHLPQYTGPLLGDKAECTVFDNTKIKTYVPKFSTKTCFSAGIEMVISYLYYHKELQTVDEDYIKNMDKLLNLVYI